MSVATDEVKALMKEEVDAIDMPLNARIHRVPVPDDSVTGVEDEVNRVYSQYRQVFTSKEDAEYFSMLPLSDTDRDRVLKRAKELVDEELAVRDEWLKSNCE